MKKKNNFNQAMFDMFGVGSNDDDMPELEKDLVTPDQLFDEPEIPDISVAEKEVEVPVTEYVAPAAPVAPVAPAAPAAPAFVLTPATYLAPGTELEGHFKSKGDVEIAGKFTGDIESEGDVTLRTNMEGTITAASLTIIDGALIGNCHVSNRVQINAGSRIEGDIVAGDLFCSGAVKGNCEIENNSSFDSTAVVEGDIVTGTMSMERGAAISGKLVMRGLK